MPQPKDLSQSNDGEVSTAASLQPMGFTDILDSMFSLYRNHFRLFVSICSVYFVIGLATRLLDGISALLLSSADHLSIISGVGDSVYVVTFLVTILATFIVTSALFFGVTQVYLGKRVTARATFRQTKRRFWSFFVSSFLYWIVIIILILFGNQRLIIGAISILAAIYVGVRWIFCSLAVVFEEKSAVQSLKRSGELVKGGWWRVFGMVIGIFLLVFFILSILPLSWGFISGVTDGTQDGEAAPQEDANLLDTLASMFALELPEPTSWRSFPQYAIWSCLGCAIYCLILPVGVIGITLVYFDRRIRKEGFDIEMRVTGEPM